MDTSTTTFYASVGSVYVEAFYIVCALFFLFFVFLLLHFISESL